jgi:hypothetical protein
MTRTGRSFLGTGGGLRRRYDTCARSCGWILGAHDRIAPGHRVRPLRTRRPRLYGSEHSEPSRWRQSARIPFAGLRRSDPQVVAAARQNVILAGFMYPCKALKGRPAAEEGLDPRLLHCSSTVHAAGLCNRSDERPGNCFSTLTGISSAGVSSLRRPSQPKACRWERPTRPSARGAVRAAGERPGRACSSTRRVWSANGNQPDGFMPSPCGQALVVTTEFAEPSRRRCGQELAVPLRYLHQLRSTPLVHLP